MGLRVQVHSESGVSTAEYAIALSILIVLLLIANQTLTDAAFNHGTSTEAASRRMAPCRQTDPSASDAMIINNLNPDITAQEACW